MRSNVSVTTLKTHALLLEFRKMWLTLKDIPNDGGSLETLAAAHRSIKIRSKVENPTNKRSSINQHSLLVDI